MQTRYEREAYQFLSVYRFLAYALAVMFTQFPLGSYLRVMPTIEFYILLMFALAFYSVLRVFSPLRWREKGTMTYLILVGDFLICILLVLFTK